MQPTLKIKVPPEIIDGTSTPLYAAYTVDNVYTVDMVYTGDTVYTVMWLKLLICIMCLPYIADSLAVLGKLWSLLPED